MAREKYGLLQFDPEIRANVSNLEVIGRRLQNCIFEVVAQRYRNI